ncbi:MAG: hypothetical protein Q7O66_22065 [Dehalococcoidia bacterium]|nr:hypothetical protein [Dehalococcoidia bacterium]
MTAFKTGTIVVVVLAILAVVGCLGPQQGEGQAPAIQPTAAIVTPQARPTEPAAPLSARPGDTPAPLPTVGANPNPTGAPAGSDIFITANPVELSQIAEISKFRSCAGHDYSGQNVDGQAEINRSMKHDLAPVNSLAGSIGKLKALAPFDGTILSIQEEQVKRGVQVWLRPNGASAWVFIFFHVDLDPALKIGSAVTAGALLGYANVSLDAHDFDIALQRIPQDAPSIGGSSGSGGGRANTPEAAQGASSQAFDSPFLHMSSAVLEQFRGKGITADNVIVSKAARDARPCTFQPGADSPDNWVQLK